MQVWSENDQNVCFLWLFFFSGNKNKNISQHITRCCFFFWLSFFLFSVVPPSWSWIVAPEKSISGKFTWVLMVFNVRRLNWSSAVLQLPASGVTADYRDYNPNFLSQPQCVCVWERERRPTFSFFRRCKHTKTAVQRLLQERLAVFGGSVGLITASVCATAEQSGYAHCQLLLQKKKREKKPSVLIITNVTHRMQFWDHRRRTGEVRGQSSWLLVGFLQIVFAHSDWVLRRFHVNDHKSNLQKAAYLPLMGQEKKISNKKPNQRQRCVLCFKQINSK